MKFSNILVPVDESTHSENAFNYALSLAEMANASITILHCHRPVPTGLGEPNFQKAIDDHTRDSYAVLKPYSDQMTEKGLSFTEKVIGGETAKTIKSVAENDECDLIVMGSKGKSDIEGLLVGSVTHKVLHIAPCPVLVVR